MPMNAIDIVRNNRPVFSAFGAQYVVSEGSPLLMDHFDGSTIDTSYRWDTAVTAGGGTVTQSAGSLTLATSTTVSAAAAISSKLKFTPVGASVVTYGTTIRFEAGQANGSLLPNAHRFWGKGTPNASFTAATPLADAIGFEVDYLLGRVQAVVYNANTRVFAQDITQYFLDALPHNIFFVERGDLIFFYVDSQARPVAMSYGFVPSTTILPMRMHMINHTTGPASAPTFVVGAQAAIDSGNNYAPAFNGISIEALRTANKFISLAAVGIAAETTIWTPAAGRRFRLLGYQLTSGTVGGNVTLKDNTAGTTILQLPFGAAASTLSLPPPGMGTGILSNAAGNVLTATGTATQTLSGFLIGVEE